jgi:hypothetical protein
MLGLAGCAGYEPLAATAEPVRIAVPPILNDSEMPQIIAPLARNVREKIAHSRNWELGDSESAEAALQITVLELERRAMARDPEDTGRPLSYQDVVRISIEWQADVPPPWGPDPVVQLETDVLLYAQPSLVDAESVAMAEVADRLAEKIIQQLDWIR